MTFKNSVFIGSLILAMPVCISGAENSHTIFVHGKEIHQSPFHYGHQHIRPTMEDAHTELNIHANYQFFAIYDGHGGSDAAHYCAEHLHNHLNKARPRNVFVPIEQRIVSAFEDTDKDLIHAGITSGCTAIIAFIHYGTIYLAHVADARGLVCDSQGNVVIATLDHTLNPKKTDCQAMHDFTATERARVAHYGGSFIYIYGMNRMTCPISQYAFPFTRAMGDADFKKYGMIATPSVINCAIPKNGIIVLACDGVWDVLTNEQVAQFVTSARADGRTQAETAQELVTEAMNAGSTDNISATVVYL